MYALWLILQYIHRLRRSLSYRKCLFIISSFRGIGKCSNRTRNKNRSVYTYPKRCTANAADGNNDNTSELLRREFKFSVLYKGYSISCISLPAVTFITVLFVGSLSVAWPFEWNIYIFLPHSVRVFMYFEVAEWMIPNYFVFMQQLWTAVHSVIDLSSLHMLVWLKILAVIRNVDCVLWRMKMGVTFVLLKVKQLVSFPFITKYF